MRFPRSLVLLTTLLVAACQAGAPPVAGPRAESEARLKKVALALKGVVMAPAGLIGNDAGSLIGADGGTLISDDGSTLIGNDGGTMVAAGAGNLTAGAGNLTADTGNLTADTGNLTAGAGNLKVGAGSYRTQDLAEAPLPNATVFLAYADGSPVVPPVVTKTDARGRYVFPQAPAGRYVVVALATTAAKRPARLLAIATAITEDTTVDLSAATTIVTAAAVDRREGPIVNYDLATYAKAVQLTAEAFAAGAPDLGDRRALAQAVGQIAAAPALAPLIARLRAEVVGTPKPRSTRPPSSPEPVPVPSEVVGPGTALIGQDLPAPTPDPGDDAPPTTTPAVPGPDDVGGPVTTPPEVPIAVPAAPTPPPAPSWFDGSIPVDTYAGGDPGFADGDPLDARFNGPTAVDLGATGDFYIVDAGNHAIRKIKRPLIGSPRVETAWGAMPAAAGAVDASGRSARFNGPRGLVVVYNGYLVADAGNHTIRHIDYGSGAVRTYAGAAGRAGDADGAAGSASFRAPGGVWAPVELLTGVDKLTIWVADTGNHRIRTIAGGQVRTVAGDGVPGFADGPGASARFDDPQAIAGDEATGAIYVADTGNHRIRKIQGGQVTTLAGDGTAGFADGAGASARFHTPTGLAVTTDGNVVVADRGNHRVRLVTPSGQVFTLAGTGGAVADGRADQAGFTGPTGVGVNPTTGTVYVVDGNRVRRIAY